MKLHIGRIITGVIANQTTDMGRDEMDGRVIDTVKRAEELLPDEDWKPFDISPPLVRQLCEEVKRLEEENKANDLAISMLMDENRAFQAELTTLRDVVEKVRKDVQYFIQLRDGKERMYSHILSLLPEVKKQTLCDTCRKADVSCPIYPQETQACVEYAEVKK